MREVAAILAERIGPLGFKVTTRKMPDFVMRAIAVFDKTAKLAINNLGNNHRFDTSKIRGTLGWTPRPLDEMVVAMAESMIAHGVVKPKSGR